TRAELAAWTCGDDSLQLAFPDLVMDAEPPRDPEVSSLAAAVARHNAAVEALMSKLRSSPDPDDDRANVLREIRTRHPDARIIAFCHYAETVNALRAKLARDPGIAALTASGARVAGGRISRNAVLAQFTPRAGPAAIE